MRGGAESIGFSLLSNLHQSHRQTQQRDTKTMPSFSNTPILQGCWHPNTAVPKPLGGMEPLSQLAFWHTCFCVSTLVKLFETPREKTPRCVKVVSKMRSNSFNQHQDIRPSRKSLSITPTLWITLISQLCWSVSEQKQCQMKKIPSSQRMKGSMRNFSCVLCTDFIVK